MSGGLDLSLDDLIKAKPKQGGRPPPREGGRGGSRGGRGISVRPTLGKSRPGRGGGGISVRAGLRAA